MYAKLKHCYFCRGVSAPVIESLERRQLLAGGTITHLALSKNVALTGDTITATAAVTANDSSTVSGVVAFLDVKPPRPTDWNYSSSSLNRVLFRDPANGVFSYASVVDTVPLAADGTATLQTSLWSGTHNLTAVFLGTNPVFTYDEPDAIMIGGPGVQRSATIFGGHNALVVTNGQPFTVSKGTVAFGGESSDDVRTVPAEGLGWSDIQSPYFQGTEHPSVTIEPSSSAMRIDVSSYVLGGWHYQVTPLGPMPALPGENDGFETSASAASNITMMIPTSLKVSTIGSHSLTNPPAVAVQIMNANGGSALGAAPRVELRGDYHSAKTTLSIQTISGGGFSGSGMETTNNALIIPARGVDPPPPPSGSVTFYDGDQELVTMQLDSNGAASFYPDPGTLALGDHQYRAVYHGDGVYTPSNAARRTEEDGGRHQAARMID